ncbi:MAG: response regulator [Holophagaceae bacterium]
MRLLLVEDKDSFRRLLVQALADSPWTVEALADPAEALRALAAASHDVMVTDLRLPSMSGLELIRQAKRLQPALRVVLMSAFGEPKDIVEAMRLGADDFLPKPFDLDVFLALLDRLRALVGAPPPDPAEPWVARSPAMRGLQAGLEAAADLPAPALFVGEPATGRSRAARRLHTLRTPKGPFVRIPSAELGARGPEPRALRLAEGGSLLLTGLEAVQGEAAVALASAMDATEGRDLRWLATASAERDLAVPLAGRFGALAFPCPPLRERLEDLPLLFAAFLQAAARGAGRPEPRVDRAVERELPARAWPGQLRELQACAARALAESEGAVVRRLPPEGAPSSWLQVPWPDPGELEEMVRAVGRAATPALLRRALEAHGGDLARAAAALGITVRVLGSRLREHGISLENQEP